MALDFFYFSIINHDSTYAVLVQFPSVILSALLSLSYSIALVLSLHHDYTYAAPVLFPLCNFIRTVITELLKSSCEFLHHDCPYVVLV